MMHEQLIRSGSETAERAQMRAEVWSGLARAQKEISPKYFYDARGSGLFEAITRLPEYYPTRTELALLHAFAPAWVARLRPRALVELGPGSAEKARTVLDGMAAGGVYMPVDISPSYLAGIVAEIGADYPHIEVVTAHSDIRALAVPPGLPRPAAFAFLGSTIGNFDAAAASALLRRVRDNMQDTDRFLLGVDLVKDVATLEAAYNDALGVTAEFNRNVLRVLNRELAANFDIDAFRHRAFWNAGARRIEMHLVSLRPQAVHVPRHGVVRFEEGETIRTEISCKYDRAAVETLFASAGLEIETWTTDARGWFALVVGRACR